MADEGQRPSLWKRFKSAVKKAFTMTVGGILRK